MTRLRQLMPAAAHFVAYVQLRSCDPMRNCDRSYLLTWQPALVGKGALVRTWGRTGSLVQTRTTYYPDRASAQAHINMILSCRLRHGYRVIRWQ